ncbi:hypothetical protein [Cohaesibacter gelatinilyticus]|uniref:Uncharacterized protein n=1 Tax=Cohaesibacter gelatinilyticus TaxID=372072 RepID=A0A285PDA0_9HYPH|nr:hypothetical protein [Cohaesibacter gelatinilyticus]SNZ19418.1 hypothetical protein SAMN06265368_2503 [Cohaesibacter gelatinilyticus]
MAVLFRWLDHSENYSICLDDAEFDSVAPAFDVLREKTGVYIDPYGYSRLSPDHAAIVLANFKADTPLSEMLKTCISEDKWIFVEGD